MTDRELLAMAAKAAGNIWLIKNANTGETYYGVCAGEGHFHGSTPQWNPLTDDGDAMRLAVDLKLRIGFIPQVYADTPSGIRFFGSHGGGNQYSQARRAFVRAAAEIGRSMK